MTYLITLAAIVFLYGPSLKYGFFQDDFLHLVSTQISSWSEFLSFFSDNQAIYYRPLGIQLVYLIQQSLFGANPVRFHIFSLLIHIINSFLVGSLIYKISKNSWVAKLSTFLYATSAIHFISLFWLAETNLLLGALMVFVNLHALFWFVKKPTNKTIFISLSLFIIGLLFHELVIIAPLMIIMLNHLLRLKLFQKPLSKVYSIGFVLITCLYLLLRLVILPIPISGTYAIHLGRDNISSLIWYGMWSLNMPEEFKYQMILSKLQFQPKFFENFSSQVIIWISGILTLLTTCLYGIIRLSRPKRSLLLLGSCWFIIGLSLFLLLPLHQYPMYALVGLPGLILILAIAIPKRPFFTILLLLAWLIPSFTTLRFAEKTHWTVQEAKLVKNIFTEIKKRYPNLPKNSALSLKDKYQVKQALADQNGVQFLYNDDSLETYFGKLDDFLPHICKFFVDDRERDIEKAKQEIKEEENLKIVIAEIIKKAGQEIHQCAIENDIYPL